MIVAKENYAQIDLADIEVDGGTQTRERTDPGVADEFAEKMGRGEVFPAAVVFYDGELYWMADGFTRYAAAAINGETHLLCEVRDGTKEDAIRYACGANDDHGQPRTNADKRKAILMACTEWPKASDAEIAKICKVSRAMVIDHRPEKPDAVEGADGKTYPAKLDKGVDLQPDILKGQEAAFAIEDHQSPYVCLWDRPTAAEIKDGVPYADVGTWEEMVEGLDIKATMAHHGGEEWPLVLRKPAAEKINARETSEGRPAIFLGKPRSADYNRRLEKKAEKEAREKRAFEAVRIIGDRIDQWPALQTDNLHEVALYVMSLCNFAAGAGAKDFANRCPEFEKMEPGVMSVQDIMLTITVMITGQKLRNCDIEDNPGFLFAAEYFGAEIPEKEEA